MIVLNLIHSIFPTTDNVNPEAEVNAWTSLFPEPLDLVLPATKAVLQKSRFSPKPADIRQEMYAQQNTGSNIASAEEAFSIARKAWRSFPAGNVDEAMPIYNALPEEIRKVYSVVDMYDLAFHTSVDQIESFEKPRFVKAYNTILERRKQEAIAGYIKPAAEIEHKQQEVKAIAENKEV